MFPSKSVAFHTTSVVPAGYPIADALFTMIGERSTRSDAVAVPISTIVSGPVESAVTSDGINSVGAVVSTTDIV